VSEQDSREATDEEFLELWIIEPVHQDHVGRPTRDLLERGRSPAPPTCQMSVGAFESRLPPSAFGHRPLSRSPGIRSERYCSAPPTTLGGVVRDDEPHQPIQSCAAEVCGGAAKRSGEIARCQQADADRRVPARGHRGHAGMRALFGRTSRPGSDSDFVTRSS
jgi:hypothetical protein